MLKNIIKGFVEMLNAINEGVKEPFGTEHVDWERDEMQNLVMFPRMRTCIRNRGMPWRKLRLSLLSFLPYALDRNVIYICTRRFSKWLIWYGF